MRAEAQVFNGMNKLALGVTGQPALCPPYNDNLQSPQRTASQDVSTLAEVLPNPCPWLALIPLKTPQSEGEIITLVLGRAFQAGTPYLCPPLAPDNRCIL